MRSPLLITRPGDPPIRLVNGRVFNTPIRMEVTSLPCGRSYGTCNGEPVTNDEAREIVRTIMRRADYDTAQRC